MTDKRLDAALEACIGDDAYLKITIEFLTKSRNLFSAIGKLNK